MNYRVLDLSDYNKYINLIKKFRNIEEDYHEFCKTFNNIKKNGEIIICEIDKNIVGTATLLVESKFIHNYSKYGHLEDVFIDPDYQGQGIATKLINLIIEIAKSNNCIKCKLNCYNYLEKFYNKNNFNENGISMINLLN